MKRLVQRKNKYGAIRTVCALGHPHPSKLESAVCQMLQIRVRAGEIKELKWQHTVELDYGIKWKIDWSFVDVKSGDLSFVEAKGVSTSDYKLKLKMFRECGLGPLEIWKGSSKKCYCVERIIPNGTK
jgi:hypothetical protein